MIRRLLLIAIFALITNVTSAGSQVPRVDVYADINHSVCSLNDQGLFPPLLFVYYFFNGPGTLHGLRFRVPKPECWVNATYAGDTTPFLEVGDSQLDWSLAFGVCLHPPVYLGRTAYLIAGNGGVAHCCQITVQPPLDNFPFVWEDCNFSDYPLTAGSPVTINPDASCPCSPPLGVESTTWGRVKALYR